MNTKAKLALERTLLQQQLRAQRQQIAVQLGAEAQNENFPRSATMRFLTGKMGLNFLVDIAIRQVCARYPGTVAMTQSMRRLLFKI